MEAKSTSPSHASGSSLPEQAVVDQAVTVMDQDAVDTAVQPENESEEAVQQRPLEWKTSRQANLMFFRTTTTVTETMNGDALIRIVTVMIDQMMEKKYADLDFQDTDRTLLNLYKEALEKWWEEVSITDLRPQLVKKFCKTLPKISSSDRLFPTDRIKNVNKYLENYAQDVWAEMMSCQSDASGESTPITQTALVKFKSLLKKDTSMSSTHATTPGVRAGVPGGLASQLFTLAKEGLNIPSPTHQQTCLVKSSTSVKSREGVVVSSLDSEPTKFKLVVRLYDVPSLRNIPVNEQWKESIMHAQIHFDEEDTQIVESLNAVLQACQEYIQSKGGDTYQIKPKFV